MVCVLGSASPSVLIVLLPRARIGVDEATTLPPIVSSKVRRSASVSEDDAGYHEDPFQYCQLPSAVTTNVRRVG
jgi:hypothetical protein